MTSPKEPPKASFRQRLSTRLSTDSRGRHFDAEDRHTRNVTWAFYGLIVVIAVIIIGGVLYGFWESNLKPVATVAGTDIGRGQLDDRTKLLEFRADRAAQLTQAALADGTIEADLANRRFTIADAERPTSASDTLTGTATLPGLVELVYQEQLAEQEGVTLTDEELQAALDADGTFAEARKVDAIIISTDELDQGQPASEASLADARERAAAAVEALRAGGDPAQITDTYGPAQNQTAWITYDDLSDTEWADRIFAAAEGDVTEPVEDSDGYQLIAHVTGIAPEQPDPGFTEAVDGAVGEAVHRRNVELEATAEKLKQKVADEAVAETYDQVQLAEIFIERSAASTDDTAGEARASHILYAPETPLDADGNPTAVADLPADDPAWAAAEAEAQAAADELRAITDVDERMAAFAERARADSDGPTGPNGGDLGWFPRSAMVSEFSDAIWDNIDPQHGDILGPVKTQFGWHVILFDAFRSSLDVRLADVQAALAADGADFAAVAQEYSDGPTAAEGGELGWRVEDFLDDATFLALSGVDVGQTTEPVDGGDGYRIYLKEAEEARPLTEADAATVRATAFSDWFDALYSEAQNDGTITVSDSVDG